MDNAEDCTTHMVRVAVAYARPDVQVVIPLTVPEGYTIAETIALSGIIARFPEIDMAAAKVGVFGKLSKVSAMVREGDRIEIYRPLLADPKNARKQRASKNASL